jgi:hypothetical protein
MTTEKQCTCESEFQDRVYGKKMRLFNLGFKNPVAKCTVCGHVIQLSGVEKKAKIQTK